MVTFEGERYCVVALFEPLVVGTQFDRAQWPAHITLVSNFVVTPPAQRLVATLRAAGWDSQPLLFCFGERSLFGVAGNIPVILTPSEDAHRLHRALVSGLRRVDGFVADYPAHWLDGYRPHLTLRPGMSFVTGERRTATHVALVRLDGERARVVGCADIVVRASQ